MSNVVDTDDFLEHFGVKGMKWGRRKAADSSGGGSSGGGKSHSELRALNKASAKKDAEAHAKEVDAARERYNTNARQKYLDAKAKYKADKAVIGKREALKAFNKVKDENIADYEKASQFRDGKEAAAGIAAAVGVSIAMTAITVALRG